MDWVDAAGNSSWAPKSDVPMKAISCRTVGWLHSKKGKALALYSEYSIHDERGYGSESVGSRNVIPKACIKKVTVIQKGS